MPTDSVHSPSPATCQNCGSAMAMGLCPACVFGGALEDSEGLSPLAELPAKVGPYTLVKKIAQGGMGVVWRARDDRLGRDVALKFLRESRLPGEDGALRFRKEAKAAGLLRHPHIVTVYEVGEDDGLYYLAMEYVPGGTLATLMRRGGLGAREGATLMAKIARAVHHAHEHGILHRDLKPANILLDADGEPRVTDFGLARLAEREDSLTVSGTMMGTPAYISPEQATGLQRAITAASDTYSLGAILYEILAGTPPFVAESQFELLRQVTDTEPLRPSSRLGSVDRHLETICLRCLEKAPSARYPSALALAEELERWLEGRPITAKPITRLDRCRRWVRRRPALSALWVALAIGSLALGQMGYLLYQAKHQTKPGRSSATMAPALGFCEVSTLAGRSLVVGSADGPEGQMNTPYAVAAGLSGNVLVGDTHNHTIRRITPDGVLTTVAGKAREKGHVDGPAHEARFWHPEGLLQTADGLIYVCDSGNHTIRKITPDGTVSTFAGVPNTKGSADGPAAAATFHFPFGIVQDAQKNLYIADVSNQIIRKITPDGMVSTLAGQPGIKGSADGIGSAARFHDPSAIAIDPVGNLIVTDLKNATLRKITPTGVVTTLVGQAGRKGFVDGQGTAGRFDWPSGVCVTPDGMIYVTDYVTSSLRRISPEGMMQTIHGPNPSTAVTDAKDLTSRLYGPLGIAADKNGVIYAADCNSFTVKKVVVSGQQSLGR